MPERRNRGRNFDWNEENEAQLRSMVAEGLSFGEAARRLGPGLTKNACAGKGHRMGLRSRVPSGQRKADNKASQRKSPGPDHQHRVEDRHSYGPPNPIRLQLGSFAPRNMTGRLMGDPPPGRTPWAQP
jgi:hypothetical protein